MWLGVLGPVECRVDGRSVGVAGRLNRALLEALAVDPDRVTGVDELIDALWGSGPPAAAEKVARNRVSLLRRLLTPAFIDTVGAGYRLGRDVTVDARLFADTRGVGVERLALWRGPPFEEIAEWPPARTAAIGLGELRSHLEEVVIAEQLDGGVDASSLVGAAEKLVETEPFRERRWALLMRILYLAGRQHDALGAFQRARVLLRDELGLTPGSELLAMERSILNQEPSLRSPTGRVPSQQLPTGTVTFLFTDIEGSTGWWDRAPEAMSKALERHDGLVRASIEGHRGEIFSASGDGLAGVFDRARDALDAAVAIQSVVRAESWPDPVRLLVRVGLNTGESIERDQSYYGSAVNRAARVMGAARGGEILVSAATERVLGGDLPHGIDLVDLGQQRLRGFQSVEHVFGVTGHGMQGSMALDRMSTVSLLPRPRVRLIGRDDVVDSTTELIERQQLVTLTGVGGVGKTSVALAVAHRAASAFPDGVWWVDLAAVQQGRDAGDAIATALGIQQRTSEPIEQSVVDALQDRRLLLVLDNCEHVIVDVAAVVDIVTQRCPDVSLLATSRERLALEGESIVGVRPLAADNAHDTAVELLLERLDGGRPDELDDYLAICRELAGLPLAIEFAASRCKSMAARLVLARPRDGLRFLSDRRRGAERQRTLEAVVQWSYSLLSDDERLLLHALSVFSGDFRLEAAEAMMSGTELDRVVTDDVLLSLVDKSLVEFDGRRYRLLEPTRQFAEQRLEESGEDQPARDRHLAYFVGFVREVRSGLRGPDEQRWHERLADDFANVRSAFRWACEREDAPAAATIVASLSVAAATFWHGEWPCTGSTDIHHQGRSPGEDAHYGDRGAEEVPSSSVVHTGVQG